jgi:hypothetical protein
VDVESPDAEEPLESGAKDGVISCSCTFFVVGVRSDSSSDGGFTAVFKGGTSVAGVGAELTQPPGISGLTNEGSRVAASGRAVEPGAEFSMYELPRTEVVFVGEDALPIDEAEFLRERASS